MYLVKKKQSSVFPFYSWMSSSSITPTRVRILLNSVKSDVLDKQNISNMQCCAPKEQHWGRERENKTLPLWKQKCKLWRIPLRQVSSPNKMNIFSLFTHPHQEVPNLFDFLLWITNGVFLQKLLICAIALNSDVQWKHCSFESDSFPRNKESHTGLEWHEGE